MSTRSRYQAVLCSLAVLVCALLINPRAEMGMDDEWSFTLTARMLADTGHLVYNGWAAPMLGWQGYLGALFIHLFGFSFSILRWSVVLIAMATAFLLHRSLVRVGINGWNAMAGTLTVVFSPLFMGTTCIFTTDTGGVFSILLCLYACLRALQSERMRAAMGWICFAALGNAGTGTVRQNAWLGIIFIVPSALWLLRSRRKVLLVGVGSWLAGVGFICYCVNWFQRQPYSFWPPNPKPITLVMLSHCAIYLVLFIFLLAYSLSPVLVAFIPTVWRRHKGLSAQLLVAVVIAGVLDFGMYKLRHHGLLFWITPFFVTGSDISGSAETFVLLAVDLLGLMGIWNAIFADGREVDASVTAPHTMTWGRLGVLLVPFTVAYIGSVMPRCMIDKMIARYLIAVLLILTLPVLKLYQEKVRWRLPGIVFLLALSVGLYTVAQLHDAFAYYRARVDAVDEIRAMGVRDGVIDGGFEFNAWTEAVDWGYVNQQGIKVPAGAYKPGLPLFPHLKPEYIVTSDPNLNADRDGFSPVTYYTWIDHDHDHKLYVYRTPPG